MHTNLSEFHYWIIFIFWLYILIFPFWFDFLWNLRNLLPTASYFFLRYRIEPELPDFVNTFKNSIDAN